MCSMPNVKGEAGENSSDIVLFVVFLIVVTLPKVIQIPMA